MRCAGLAAERPSTLARSWVTVRCEVSMTRSALSRSGRSSSRSAAMPSTSRPSPCSGWLRRTCSNRRISTSSSASRNSTRGLKPRASRSLSTAPQVGGERAAAHVHHHGDPGDLAAGRGAEVDHRGDQLRRQVVHHVAAEVLQHLGRRAAPGPGQAGDQHDLDAGRLARAPVTRGPARRVDGGLRSSRSAAGCAVQRGQDRRGGARADAGHRGDLLDLAGLQLAQRAEVLAAGRPGGSRPGRARRPARNAVIRLERRWRWKVMANRCASSRTRCSRYSPSLVRGRITGSGSSGSHTSSSRLASPHTATSVMPSSASTSAAALTCGWPPSTTTRLGG